MSVLIKDMGKPKSCYAVIDGEYEYCPFVNTDDDCVLLLKKGTCEGTWADQYSKCPLIEAPELCEDAVSRQAVIDAIERNAYRHTYIDQIVDIIKELPSAQPEKLTDKEQRIFLSAMGREEEVCKEVDDAWRDCREPYEDSLVHVCKEIRRKVKGALWT